MRAWHDKSKKGKEKFLYASFHNSYMWVLQVIDNLYRSYILAMRVHRELSVVWITEITNKHTRKKGRNVFLMLYTVFLNPCVYTHKWKGKWKYCRISLGVQPRYALIPFFFFFNSNTFFELLSLPGICNK